MRARILRVWILVASVLFSCTPSRTVSAQITISLEDGLTRILSVDKDGREGLIEAYPSFPGLDTRNARLSENMIRFTNGNVLLRIPDKSETKPVRAWNDLSHLFDVLFVDSARKAATVVIRDQGVNIRIVKSRNEDSAFILQVQSDSCIVRHVTKDGTVAGEARYTFRSYPSRVEVVKTPAGYEILHVTIDSEERFLLDQKGAVRSILYRDTSAGDGKH